ncbi:MAG TPA: hypothetical protein VLT85_09870 [Terriglobales bacterium]|nr:hypothetical protein [Terriglobales bacterium]
MPATSGKAWMSAVLWAAAAYNLVWGAAAVLDPGLLFRWAKMPPPNYPAIWQCVGMMVGVYGVGYAIAATDPLRHWALVAVGFLGKLAGPLGLVYSAWQGTLPWRAGWLNVGNDLIWWLPFALILRAAWRQRARTSQP